MPEPTTTPAPTTPSAAPAQPKKARSAAKVIKWPTHRPAYLAPDKVAGWYAIVEIDGKEKEIFNENFDKLTKKLHALQQEQGE